MNRGGSPPRAQVDSDLVACPHCGRRNRVPRAGGVTLLLLRDGREVARQVGAVPAERLIAFARQAAEGHP